MQFYEIKVCQAMFFKLYNVYNKHKMIEIDNQTGGKLQVLS